MTRFYSPAIDPRTGEYSVVDGDLVNDDTVASEAVLALRSRRASSPIAMDYGSRLHTIRKLTADAPARARIYTKEALQFLVDRGSMRELRVEPTVTRSDLPIAIYYRDRSGKPRSITYEHVVTG